MSQAAGTGTDSWSNLAIASTSYTEISMTLLWNSIQSKLFLLNVCLTHFCFFRVHRLEIAASSLHDAGDYTFVPEGYSQSLSAKIHIIGTKTKLHWTRAFFLLFIVRYAFYLSNDLVWFSADPPRVHLDSLNFPDNTVTVVAGNKLRLEIPISGEPAPRVVWMKGERVRPFDSVLTPLPTQKTTAP